MPCHRIGPGTKNLVGPELNGLDGRHTGSVAGYNYSAANKNSGVTWNQESFEKYIKDPRSVIPGTKMFLAGIKNEKDIRDLWAYLKQFGPDGKKCRKPAGRWWHFASVDLGQCPPSQWHA